jgi:hypothetical protein
LTGHRQQAQPDDVVADQFAEADATIIVTPDQAVFGKFAFGKTKLLRSACDQETTGLRCRLAQGTAVIWMVSLAMVAP